MNKYVRLIIAVVLSSLTGFLHYNPSEFFISTIFNVSGIIFSVGLGLIVTFNMNGVKNKPIINSIRRDLAVVRNSFILYFAISTIAYITNNYLITQKATIQTFNILHFNTTFYSSLPICVIMLYAILYFVFNFFEIQKLNESLYDEINKQ